MVAELVGVTLGSKGRNVVLQNKYGPPRSSMTVRLSSNSLAPTKPPTMRNDKKQLEPVKIVEDITNGITSGIQSSSPVSPYASDEPVGDLISPTATEVESVNEESEYEDDKADEEDKNESFSDAMIAEMEASIYGLQVGDFGLWRIKRNTLVSGGVRGTLPWMAPELLNGSSIRVSRRLMFSHLEFQCGRS